MLIRFLAWLRRNSERYLLAAAQEDMARKYGTRGSASTAGGARHPFWTNVFVPTYRVLPWPVRRAVLHAMPGSHRQFARRPPRPARRPPEALHRKRAA